MLPSPVRPVLAALLAACASEPPAPPPPRAPRVLVPPEQLSLRTETLPVQVELPAAAVGETPVVRLDGAEVDATAFIRAWGPRALLIGELDLSKTSEGVHSLEVSTPSTSIDRTFSLTRPPCPLTLQVRDHKRQPTPARVVIWDAEGPLSILGEAAPKEDRSKREAALDSVFVPTGTGRVWLDPGAHTLAATRGLRAGVAIATVDACETPELELVLGQGLSTTRRAADLHVHTGHSPDAWIPDPRRLRSLATSGLDVAVITDHNTLDWPALDRSSPQQLLGVEHTHGPQGLPLAHLNAFPIAPEATLPDSTGRSLAGTLDDLRALPGVRYVQLDHPRGVDLRLLPNAQPVKAPPYKAGTTLLDRSMSYAIWSYPGLDRLAPLSADANAWLQRPDPNTGTNALEVDSVEVLNRSSVSRWLEVRADWFYLLNRGVWLTGTGNSDSHDAAVELAGMPSNLLPDAELVDALQSGDVLVSTGPVPELRVRTGPDQPWRGPGEQVSGPQVEVKVDLSAAPWVPVQQLRLIVNGEVVEQQTIAQGGDPTGAALAHEARWTVPMTSDGWLLVEAGWPLDGTPAQVDALPTAWRMVARGYVPIGFSNPVRVDADGDGRWSPGG